MIEITLTPDRLHEALRILHSLWVPIPVATKFFIPMDYPWIPPTLWRN